ncbi:hypothetical protein C8Q76DRAFT_711736 [Earliella scabrosa]|nr:hypothetical protein C8Q76DRAFT_711736 [Earliella scabrosa]
MPVSEIDAIFASKGKPSVAPTPKASSSSSLLSEKKKKKKKDKDKGKGKEKDSEKSAKRKRDDDDEQDAAPSRPPKRQVPETVFDPSASLPSAKKSKPLKADKSAAVTKVKKPKKDREEEQRFKDSRGTGPRRKTEEGFAIYKEDELGISTEGGDTPLCPFDCQCCF